MKKEFSEIAQELYNDTKEWKIERALNQARSDALALSQAEIERLKSIIFASKSVIECVRREAQYGIGGGRCWLALVDSLSSYDVTLEKIESSETDIENDIERLDFVEEFRRSIFYNANYSAWSSGGGETPRHKSIRDAIDFAMRQARQDGVIE